ncbi:class I SAM-dependent DNA methyltransferase [Rhizobium sp. PL01]|uniref:class I SAM-dependent DNA methyltransferase n=1 Tax=Rhizobium sp. PL01 TaxID=3085631 RepID=UPI0029826B4C|nr:DNA methyltransferase [Rhizobium sp. PL01]MDW5314397.1 type IIL restriction-modification enzyme MmeI [Rhizobium sp. PL01]
MTQTVETFITRWQGQEGGQERANYALFLTELCDLLGLPHADPASAMSEGNDYVFERAVRENGRDGSVSNKRIDLYKRNCFILEAKQSRLSGDKKLIDPADAPTLPGIAAAQRGRRGAGRAWDVLMMNARQQAENYVRLLPASHEPPPFVLVCDVGHCIEVYANFRRDGKAYDQFPDRRSFRVYLEDLRDPAVRDRLVAIWREPLALDPSRHAARVTREIAGRIAKVSKALEEAGHATEEVAMFLMRVLFTMFAEDVELLPKESFKNLLKDCAQKPEIFPGMMEDLWKAMDEGGFTATIREKVKKFNGEFFKKRRALKLAKEEIGELAAAASYDWKDVEPAIFGTFLEQALDPDDRRRLGAHYTPRAYVERLVIATIIDPLRAEWGQVLSTAERQKAEARGDAAVKTVQAFHDRLCETRVLDPACGTGNFLYVSLELMKRLEGEVLEALADLGGQEALTGLESHTVDPHQFLGMELNPRAAAIAELVLWIGHLQWHFRTKGAAPSEPILRAFHNIQCMDAVLKWDGYPLPQVVDGKEVYPNPRRPDWPKADYIVGNPPFIPNRKFRALLGDAYTEALSVAYLEFNQAADFVLFFWINSLNKRRSFPERVGFVSTSRLRLTQNRTVFDTALGKAWRIVFAIPDHDWPSDADAAVRVCFVTVSRDQAPARLVLAPDHDKVAGKGDAAATYEERTVEVINSALSAGQDFGSISPLLANVGMCHAGVKPYSRGLHIDQKTRDFLFRSDEPSVADVIAPKIFNGHDIGQKWRGYYVLDFFGKGEEELKRHYPRLYHYILENVKPQRDKERNPRLRKEYWLFEANRVEMRNGISGLVFYLATLEKSPQRAFVTIDSAILPDQKLRVVVSDDLNILGVLTSRFHEAFSIAVGGRAGVANTPVYNTQCFTKFPFPDATDAQKQTIAAIAEELDAHRKRVLAEHQHLTLTGLYNVLDKLKAGTRPDDLETKERLIFDDGLVLIMKELHKRLDVAVADAYGWPVDLPEEEVLANLVALNRERAKEEKRGQVRWLRPDYQVPRFGSEKEKAKQLEADFGIATPPAEKAGPKPTFPPDDIAQTGLVMNALISTSGALDAGTIAASFKQGRKVMPAISSVLVSLARMGLISTTDGGKTFAYRRAA